MRPGARALFVADLYRELGGNAGLLRLGAAVLAGLGAGWIAADFVASPDSLRPALFEGVFTRYQRSSLYLIGLGWAWRSAGLVAADGSNAWPHQYFAAGASRDRYLIALATASAAAALAIYAVTSLAWAGTLALTGSAGAVRETLTLLPAAALWLLAASAFGAAAVAVAGSASGGQALMLLTLALPIVVVLTAGEALEAEGARWPGWLFIFSPPYGARVTLRFLSHCVLYTAAAMTIAYLLSFRLLRVR